MAVARHCKHIAFLFHRIEISQEYHAFRYELNIYTTKTFVPIIFAKYWKYSLKDTDLCYEELLYIIVVADQKMKATVRQFKRE